MDLGLKHRVAIVTGGAAGIGAAIAETLALEGCRVWIADRDFDAARRTAAALPDGTSDRAVRLDVAEAACVEEAFQNILRAEKRLDVLVCNAGVLRSQSFVESSAADWEAVSAVNLTGVVNCCRAASRPMLDAGRGRIVNIASISAARGGGSVGNVLYGTSKAGVVALTLGLAREFGPSGVTVNAIAPAIAETAMTRESLTEETRARIVARVPLRRLATPSDIADAAAFLASDRASFITGAVLPVDGGLSIASPAAWLRPDLRARWL